MKKYIKWILYHLASSAESAIKFLFAIFKLYPQINISDYVLCAFESRRIDNDIDTSIQRRNNQLDTFKSMRSEAYCDEI